MSGKVTNIKYDEESEDIEFKAQLEYSPQGAI